MKLRVSTAVLAAFVCVTCAHAEIHYYLVDSIATQAGKADLRAQAHELEKIYADMEQASGVDAKLIYSTDPDINAFATEVGSDKIVVVQEGLLETMDGDRDAVAAVLGHELGHHKADHIRAGKRKQEGARVLGAILGAVVGAKVGRHSEIGAVAAGAAGGVVGNLVALKFNRDQEMEADRLSVGWMIQAGYNPDGMLRLQKHLGELAGHSKAAIFSTHPTSEKRYKAAQQQIAKLSPPPELLGRPVEPLVGADALAAATAEIKKVRDDAIAQALKPDGAPVSASALVPVNKVSFDTYAALQNQLLFAGDKGKPQLLAKNHLTETQLAQADATFTERMTGSPALAQRYSADFFRASQGKYAAYGRDLADSYEKGQPLQLDPPYPVDTAAQIFAEMRKHAGDESKATAQVLKPQGLSYYDYLITYNWWMRKAKIAMLTGDASILHRFYDVASTDDDSDDDDTAAQSNVHVGNNVQMGNNVRIGGKPVKTGSDKDR